MLLLCKMFSSELVAALSAWGLMTALAGHDVSCKLHFCTSAACCCLACSCGLMTLQRIASRSAVLHTGSLLLAAGQGNAVCQCMATRLVVNGAKRNPWCPTDSCY